MIFCDDINNIIIDYLCNCGVDYCEGCQQICESIDIHKCICGMIYEDYSYSQGVYHITTCHSKLNHKCICKLLFQERYEIYYIDCHCKAIKHDCICDINFTDWYPCLSDNHKCMCDRPDLDYLTDTITCHSNSHIIMNAETEKDDIIDENIIDISFNEILDYAIEWLDKYSRIHVLKN